MNPGAHVDTRGLRTEEPVTHRANVVDLGVRSWLAGHVVSAVQVEVLTRTEDDED